MSLRDHTFTYRCPDCRRDTKLEKPGAFHHRNCQANVKPGYMVLVEIDGDDVSRPSDPKPLSK